MNPALAIKDEQEYLYYNEQYVQYQEPKQSNLVLKWVKYEYFYS